MTSADAFADDRRRFLRETTMGLIGGRLMLGRSLFAVPGFADQAPLANGPLSSLDRASTWINTSALTAAGLRGKPVLVQFWTFTCVNWLRTLPYVRAWAE